MDTPDLGSGLSRLLAVEPALVRVARASEALGLAPMELLHAGPPLRDPRQPPAVLRSAVVMTALHEGWAADADSAEAMLRAGTLLLSPAQDRGAVTPLAAVIASGTPLFGVADLAPGAADGRPVWAPVSPVRGPDTRMGHRDPALRALLQRRDEVVAPAFAAALAADGPLPLWPLAAAGLADGDDLHSRTTGATAALVAALRPSWQAARVAQGAAAPASDPTEALVDDLAASPLFFLTLWMAACRLVLRAAEGGDRPGLVTRAGGNGEQFAISLAGAPATWTGTAAVPPLGWRLPSASAGAPVCPAIGDSAVIDLLGFGAQRLAQAPEPLGVLGPWLPADPAELAARLLLAPQPKLLPAWPLGLDAAEVRRLQLAPMVALAMIGDDGRCGLIGRGVYRPPVALFEAALEALNTAAPGPAATP